MTLERYSRQILFSGIGPDGQERLTNSHAVIVGCGALGAMQAEMLARAGVGRLRLIDRDFVEESNLQRQIMFEESDVADKLPKAIAAESHVKRINSAIAVEAVVKDVNYTNVESLIHDADVVLDGTDNFEARFLLNDAAMKLNRPWIYGAAVGSYGVQMTIRPHLGPCLRCVFPEMPAPGTTPTCDTAGVILPIIATVASHQVAEALKLLTGRTDQLHGSLLQFDVWENRSTRVRTEGLRGAGRCRVCDEGQYDFLTARAGQLVTTLCGRNAVQITPAAGRPIIFAELAERLRGSGQVSYNRYLLKFKSGEHEITVFPDARSIIKGTDDPNFARSLYARFIGT
ncbi:MAG TPA: ThiF family adenylyltransferase [Blastocatellia bacterium]|nr:ThiF family adenylyltransferase [Blastocatellia bacterium]